jgi:hypothetical protein
VTRKHAEDDTWGTSAHRYADLISDIINKSGASEVLDYGCGKGELGRCIKPNHSVRVYLYDPGIPKLDTTPEPREMVVCSDVMEHIEPEFVDDVLDDLKRLTLSIGFINICTFEVNQYLPDGRNAHITVQPVEWWLPKIMERFELHSMSVHEMGFWAIVKPKEQIKQEPLYGD